MDPLQTSILITSHTRPGEAWSARPDAPVVPDAGRRPAVAATRTHLAGALHRLADAVAPTAVPPRQHAYAGGRSR